MLAPLLLFGIFFALYAMCKALKAFVFLAGALLWLALIGMGGLLLIGILIQKGAGL